MLYLISGIAASSIHVVSGPDHLAAVTPIAIESKKRSWLVGLAWGTGHTLGVFIIGILALLFRDFIPVELISAFSEQIVGILLIIIGSWILLRIFTHRHTHTFTKKKGILSALTIGIVHGLAGVSHLIGILPSLSLPSNFDAAMYVSGFGIGTVLSMVIYTNILGRISHKVSHHNNQKYLTIVRLVGSFAAIGVGIFWILQ